MTDLATLGIAIDTSSIPSAINSVKGLGDTAATTEKQTASLTATASAQIAVISALQQVTDSLSAAQIRAAGGWQSLNADYSGRVDKLLASVDKYSAAQLKSNNVIKEADSLYEAGALSAGNFALVLGANANNFDKTAASIKGTAQEIQKLKELQAGSNFAQDLNNLMGVGVTNSGSAKDSAAVFQAEIAAREKIISLKAVQEGQNFSNALNDVFNFDAIGKSAKESASYYQELQKVEDELTRLKALQAGSNFAQDLNSSFGIGNKSKSAKDSASAFVEAEKAAAAEKAAVEIKAAEDGAQAVSSAEALKRSAMAATDGVFVSTVAKAKEANVSIGLVARETVTIFRELARGDLSRLGSSVTLLAQGFGALSTAMLPFTIAIVAVIAAFAGLVAIMGDYDNYISVLNLSTTGLGQSTGKTAAELQNLAHVTAETTGISENAAASQQQALIRLGVTNTDVLQRIQGELKDYMAATGDKAPQALKVWADAMKDPTAGAIALNEKVGGLSGDTYELIKKLQEEGNVLGADTILIDTFSARTKNAATQQSEFSKAIDGTKKAVGDFFLSAGKNLFGDAGPTKRDKDYGGFGGADSMAEDVQIANAKAEASRKAIKVQDEENKASLLAAQTIDQYAPKYEKLTELKHARQLIDDQMSKSGFTEKGSAAVQEINDQIAALEKVKKVPKTPEEKFSDKTSALTGYNAAMLEIIKNYQEGGESAMSYAAHAKAVEEAHGKNATAAEVEARAHAILTGELNKAIEAEVQKNRNLSEAGDIQQKYNDEVANGNLSRKEADKLQQNEIVLLPLAKVLLDSKGTAQHAVAEQAYNDYKNLLDQDYLGKETAKIQGVIESLNDQNAVLKLEQSTLGLSNKERAIRLAMMQEEQKLGPHAAATPEGQKAIGQAGANSGLATDISNMKSPLSTNADLIAKNIGEYQALVAQIKAGTITADQFSIASKKIVQNQMELNIAMGKGNGFDIMATALGRLAQTGKTTSMMLTDNFATFFQTFEDGFANSIGKAAIGTQKLGKSLLDVANQGVSAMIAGLVKVGEQYLINQAISMAGRAADTAAGIAMAASLSTAYAPAAMAASIMTLGSADVAGTSGFMAALASAQIATIPAGMANGGFVMGQGGPREDNIHTMLSAGEYVINAQATAANRPLLDAINKGQSVGGRYANGGIVGSSTPSSVSTPHPGGVTFNFQGANFGGADPADIEKRFRNIIETQYAPALLASARQQANSDVNSRVNRQRLNGRTN